ncbi:MAG: 2-phosphosulfolactate phosphatase [Candidatus Methanomethylicia archaeon]
MPKVYATNRLNLKYFKEEYISIVVDVLRCSTTIITAIENGAEGVIPAATIKEARALRKVYVNAVLAGERDGIPPKRFNLGNSPHEFKPEAINGRLVILTTTSGTRTIKSASRLGPTLIGGIINIKAVSEAAYKLAVERGRDIVIVMAGRIGLFFLEDFIGAGLIANELEKYNVVLDDVATASLNLVKNSDWRSLAEKSEHANYLASIGFGRDVVYALTPNISSTVPILINNIITKLGK